MQKIQIRLAANHPQLIEGFQNLLLTNGIEILQVTYNDNQVIIDGNEIPSNEQAVISLDINLIRCCDEQAGQWFTTIANTKRNGHNGCLTGTKPDSVYISPLTKRQLEILERIAKGVTYRETAEALGLRERTVKYHMARITELLQMENRAQVIAYAAKFGLIDNARNIE